MSGLIKRIFKEENLNSLLITAVFLFFTGWWVVLYFGFGETNSQPAEDWSTYVQIITMLGAYIGFFILRQSAGKNNLLLPRRVIQFFTFGILCQALGSTVYAFYIVVLGIAIPYPSWAEVFFFGSVLLYLAGTILLYTDVINKIDLRKAISSALAWLVLLGAGEIYLLQQMNYFVEFKLTLKPVLDGCYYVFQPISAALALGALTATRCFAVKKFRIGYILLTVGVISQFLADFYYSYAVSFNIWTDGGWGGYFYLFAYSVASLGLVQFATSFIAINILAVLLNSFFFIQLLLSNSISKNISNGIILVISLVFSYFLLRRNKNEVAQKEKLARLDVLEESHRQLQELDKQKTEFLNIAAHQLRTPVSIIRNYIAMMQDGDFGAVPAGLAEVHSHIYQSNQWLVHLADEFLNIAHLESGQTKYHFEPGDLRLAIRDVVQELRPKAEQKGLALNVEAMPNSLPAQFDQEKMKHAILNFIENAIKYTPAGTITVSARAVDDGIEVVVRDTGMGFSAADQQGFFQKFQRGKNASQIEVNTSTGLGLYIARMFVEGHNGKVWAKSDGLGKGSEFSFLIPIKTVV